MDAKMRANFINSVAGAQKIPCPSCNTLNEPNSKFCIICGHPLKEAASAAAKIGKIICPSCKAENSSDSKFCMFCGTKLNSVSNAVTDTPVPVVTPVRTPKVEPATPQNTNTAGSAAFSSVKRSEVGSAQSTSALQPNAPVEKKQAFKFVETTIVEEEASVFAQGLPSWDIVPPQIMVRRKAKK